VQILKPILFTCFFIVFASLNLNAETKTDELSSKKLAYLISDIKIPFWDIMWRGSKAKAKKLGYEITLYSSENNAKAELQFAIKAINDQVSGIIISPTNSSACVTILKFAKKAGIPVVISDIGTDEGEYISYISSDNENGAYNIGKILTKKMLSLGWQDGRVGIIAIPQKRTNGQARTKGFMRAMNEAGIKGAGIWQQNTFSYQETYDYAKDLIEKNPDLRAIWLQGSNRYQGALDAIKDADKKNKVLLLTFDAEPEFLDLIPKGIIVGAGMQQPFLMGEKAVETMHQHLKGLPVDKNQQLSILAISAENIKQELPIIKRNVLGLTSSK